MTGRPSFFSPRLVGRKVDNYEAHDEKRQSDQGGGKHPVHVRSPRLMINPMNPDVKLIATLTASVRRVTVISAPDSCQANGVPTDLCRETRVPVLQIEVKAT